MDYPNSLSYERRMLSHVAPTLTMLASHMISATSGSTRQSVDSWSSRRDDVQRARVWRFIIDVAPTGVGRYGALWFGSI